LDLVSGPLWAKAMAVPVEDIVPKTDVSALPDSDKQDIGLGSGHDRHERSA
jgi:hypothetical protein